MENYKTTTQQTSMGDHGVERNDGLYVPIPGQRVLCTQQVLDKRLQNERQANASWGYLCPILPLHDKKNSPPSNIV